MAALRVANRMETQLRSAERVLADPSAPPEARAQARLSAHAALACARALPYTTFAQGLPRFAAQTAEAESGVPRPRMLMVQAAVASQAWLEAQNTPAGGTRARKWQKNAVDAFDIDHGDAVLVTSRL